MQNDPLFVDAIAPLRVRQGFEDVGFACPAIGIVGPSENVELNPILILGNGLSRFSINETDLVEDGITTVQHNVKRPAAVDFLSEFDRQSRSVGLERAIDGRSVCQDFSAWS